MNEDGEDKVSGVAVAALPDALSASAAPPGMHPWPTTDWNFPFEGPLDEVFPALHEAQNAWMSQIDSLLGARPQDPRAHPAWCAR